MNILKNFFKDTSTILRADFERSRNLTHNGEKGKNREYFIDNFLKKAFPSKFVIGTGEIIDSSEGISKQADIIIYDEYMPIFDYGLSSHFLSGGVLAHIEVKTELNSNELVDVISKANSVKELKRDIDSSMSFGDKPTNIFSCCFAYEGLEKKTFKEKVLELYKDTEDSKMIDVICVLDKYIMLKWANPNTKKFEFIFLETKEDTLMYFFSRLFYAMQKNWAGVVQIEKYLNLGAPSAF